MNQSRDFQLIGRAYDCVINGVKFDIDTMLQVVNTEQCNERMLQLLQTKLGFFSDKNITDDELRYVLRAFPIIVKNKGSRKAIKQAIYAFLKAKHINTDVNITITNNSTSELPYMVRIAIKAEALDTTILNEIMKYILPAGYGFYYLFYTEAKGTTPMELHTTANAVYITDELNSQIRSASDDYDASVEHIIGAVDTTEVISSDSDGVNTYAVETYTNDEV